MTAYIEFMFQVGFALLATAFALLLACCVGGIVYTLYKGLTDETWR